MASFEERSISSKVDSSDAETNENSSEKVRFSRLNVEISAINVNLPSVSTMAEHLSTTDNVIVKNRVQLQTSSNDNHSDASSGQTNCSTNSIHGQLEAENIVSSTQETANDTFNVKLNSERMESIVNKCDVTNVKSAMPKSIANEKHSINSEQQSHVCTASALSSQSRKTMDEPKRHSHINDSSKSKTKPSDGGLYSFPPHFTANFLAT